jgi:hypothetical protein
MRRVGQKRIVSPPTTSATPPVNERAHGSLIAELEARGASLATVDPVAAEPAVSSNGPVVSEGAIETEDRALRRRQLPDAIRKRIESRLPGRVRKLVVRIQEGRVVLEGECTTYYTKQLAQHAALGILEDEQLENAIVVNVPR